jgi:hypothetical protein
MSKLMLIVGILLVAVAVALGLMIYFSPASIVAWGITVESAVTLLVGGILSIGFGGTISALDGLRQRLTQPAAVEATAKEADKVESAVPEFGRRSTDGARPGTSPSIVFSPSVTETIDALEQAKNDIRQALGGEPVGLTEPPPRTESIFATPSAEPAAAAPEPQPPEEKTAPAPEQAPVVEAEPEPEPQPVEEEEEEGQLYVLEERIIRSRPARILSDGTVEAETDEGWMRFENLEHLDEYMDAVAAGQIRS